MVYNIVVWYDIHMWVLIQDMMSISYIDCNHKNQKNINMGNGVKNVF